MKALAAEGGPRPEDLAELRHALRSGTVVIGPLETYAPAARRILAMGYTVHRAPGRRHRPGVSSGPNDP